MCKCVHLVEGDDGSTNRMMNCRVCEFSLQIKLSVALG